MILDDILADKRLEVEARRGETSISELKSKLSSLSPARDFRSALSGISPRTDRSEQRSVRMIAEVKKASPSKGLIRPDFQPVEIAKCYESAGASVISVLTDEKYFQGKLAYLEAVHEAVRIPCLRKDFIIDPYQIFEARASEADAILLIVAALEKNQLVDLLGISTDLGMGTLVESHNEEELEIAIEIGAKVIGINNRDLRTFHTTLETSEKLAGGVPSDRVLVAESGIFTKMDVDRLSKAGVDAILVGESLMRESDPAVKIRELGIG